MSNATMIAKITGIENQFIFLSLSWVAKVQLLGRQELVSTYIRSLPHVTMTN